MSNNDITGDSLTSKIGNQEAYSDGWDRIFGKEAPDDVGCDGCSEINVRLVNGLCVYCRDLYRDK